MAAQMVPRKEASSAAGLMTVKTFYVDSIKLFLNFVSYSIKHFCVSEKETALVFETVPEFLPLTRLKSRNNLVFETV